MGMVDVAREGSVVRITMNRAAKRNALSAEHLTELLEAFREAGSSDAAGIVLAAEGPVFSAGHDFGDVHARDEEGVRLLLTAGASIDAVATVRKNELCFVLCSLRFVMTLNFVFIFIFFPCQIVKLLHCSDACGIAKPCASG